MVRCKLLIGVIILALGVCFVGIFASPKVSYASTNYIDAVSVYMQNLSLLDVKITILDQSKVGTIKVSADGGAEEELMVPESDGSFHWTRSGLSLGTTRISVRAYDFAPAPNLLEERNYLVDTTGQLVEQFDATQTAADVAAGITSITPPASGATSLVIPSVPLGFSIQIKSSSVLSVVSLSGVITPPATDTTVGIVLTVVCTADGTSADTSSISVVVPANTSTIYGAPIQITVGKGLARPDKTTPAKSVRIPINVDSTTFSTGFSSYSFDITYDPSKINPTGIVAYTSDNKNGIAVPASLGQITTTDSTHASVHVQWSGTIPVGATYAISKGILSKIIFTAQSSFVSTDLQTGIGITTANFTLNSNPSNNVTPTAGIIYFGMYGDVTGDGFITSADTTQILRYTLTKTSTLTTPAKLLAADVSGDTFITSADNTQILRYTLTKSSTLTTLFQY